MIVFLVPELEDLLADSSVPALLRRFFARASSRQLDANGYLADLVTGRPIASAAIARFRDRPDDCSGAWMFADPVALRPDLSAVWIQSGCFDPLDQPAVAELKDLFEQVNLAFELTTPERAYLRLEQIPDASFSPSWAVAGQSMDYVLPKGRDAKQWIRLLNDSQIILHQHAAGQASSETDLTQTPSGLWFWGAGKLPENRPSGRISHLIGDDEELLALANYLEISHSPDESETADSSLRSWSPPSTLSADEALVQLVELIRPYWRRLQLGAIDALEIASRNQAFNVTSRKSRHFWRRGP